MEQSQIAQELFLFADLDCEPIATSSAKDWIFSFTQNSDDVLIRISQADGKVVETRSGKDSKYKSYRGLLGSAGFGNLKRFVEAQKALILRDAPYIQNSEAHLPIVGELEVAESGEVTQDLLSAIDGWFRPDETPSGGIKALVVDGPAGIGKTHLIRALAFGRAQGFTAGAAPPILHVQSRGRKLTGLTDVIAGTLQAMRIALTFDQIPILAKHGLLQIAIDGFDELADPSGYDTAWGSLRDFVESIQGNGGLLLAGRDTFIDASSVKKALPLLDTSQTASAHLRPLLESEATRWLSDREWETDKLAKLKGSGLFDEGSYALRPFFMSQIANFVSDDQEFDSFISFPLRSLISALVLREARLLEPALVGLDIQLITQLLHQFFGEIAREMFDGETDSIDEATATILIDFVFGDACAPDQLDMLRHRVIAFALLDQDIAHNHRRFPHTEIKDYFAGRNLIRLIGRGERSKAIKRNIIGSDFLETFHDIMRRAPLSEAASFFERALDGIKTETSADRTRRNLASLVLAGLSDTSPLPSPVYLSDLPLDEVFMREKVGPATLVRVDLGHLDIRGADVSALVLVECQIGTLLADSTSALPETLPVPGILMIDEKARAKPVVDTRDVGEWITQHKPISEEIEIKSASLVYFEKLCRTVLRQNWLVITEIDDDRTSKLLSDERWPEIEKILSERDLLRYKISAGVSGPRSDFVTILRAFMFIDPTCTEPDIAEIKSRINALG